VRFTAIALLATLALNHSRPSPPVDWRVYGGDKGSTRYSPLTEINRSNVAGLKVAWVFHTGDMRADPPTTMECSPIVVDGVMYVTSASVKVFAVNAATGEKLWQFDPGPANQAAHRGVTYWASGGDRRILFTAANWLYALDARTGKPIPSFGYDGKVNLREGLDREIGNQRIFASTPGMVFKDLIIIGTSVGEGPDPTPPGHVRAYNVRTGRQAWIFHTIPHPGELGYETWSADSWKTSGSANCWGGMSVDEKRGTVYLALGSPAYDFFGSDRIGDNLYANSVVALKADSGRYLWHFQTVHHDIWDYDLPCPPVLATLTRDGKRVDAVAQVTKMGLVFVLDRDTGKPLFPVDERPCPASTLPGETAARTQPIPQKPPALIRQRFTESDVTDISPEAHADVLKRFREAVSGGIYTPPTTQPMIQFPGFHGGANWSGAAFDPTTGRLYVNVNEVQNIQTMVAAPSGSPYAYLSTGYVRFTDPEGYPAIKPPWGTLNSVDLNRGDIAWKTPLGEYPELVKRGIRGTGTENFGGCIVTAGGLVFIGATKDSKFHAFDKETGKLLWESTLEAGGNATPCTYEAGGKQYVVIAAGGGRGQRSPERWDTKPGDAFVAFALP
jgi:quinoprotein glucose dehydrogenase